MRLRPWTPLLLIALFSLPRGSAAQTAEELIPFEKLPVELRKELWRIAKRPTVRRKVKERTMACREATFHYLLKRLPLASTLVRTLEIGDYIIEKKDEGFSIDDDDGAFANCKIVFEESNRVVIVARGYIQSGLFPKVYGTGVIIIRTRKVKESKSPQIRADCRVYFRLRDNFLHLATKAFRKTLGRVVERRLTQFIDCAAKIAEIIARDPQQIARAMDQARVDKAIIEDFRRRYLRRAH